LISQSRTNAQTSSGSAYASRLPHSSSMGTLTMLQGEIIHRLTIRARSGMHYSLSGMSIYAVRRMLRISRIGSKRRIKHFSTMISLICYFKMRCSLRYLKLSGSVTLQTPRNAFYSRSLSAGTMKKTRSLSKKSDSRTTVRPSQEVHPKAVIRRTQASSSAATASACFKEPCVCQLRATSIKP